MGTYPFALDATGGEVNLVFPSMPKGEIVGIMAKIFIDGNRDDTTDEHIDEYIEHNIMINMKIECQTELRKMRQCLYIVMIHLMLMID